MCPANHDSPWRLQFGANLIEGGVQFRVWAPRAEQLSVCIAGRGESVLAMERGPDDVFTGFAQGISAGAEYSFALDSDRNRRRPDPVSRYQPHGVHGPSRVIDPDEFEWSDGAWRGLPLEELFIYELHTGTFTPEGNFDGIIGRLPYLRDLGITAIEIMPIATFPGSRNWGYDGVDLYAPHPSYGGPSGLKRLVDACHRAGIAMVLDVVYNHLGPEGNYLAEYAPYFTDTYRTPWGAALNFDGAQSDGVRRFFIENALYWLTEFHIDALRLDAVHGIYDLGAVHVLREIADAFHHQARLLERKAWLIAESDLNDPKIINPRECGGYTLDAQWNDDFHHAVHTALTGDRSGYFVDFGRLADVAKAITEGFVYDGRRSEYRERRHGAPSVKNSGSQFVVFNQNHDQIANADAGMRLSALLSPDLQRVASVFLICAPNLPMYFMGEEFGASTPFNYFTSFTDPDLARAVSEGRKKEYGPFFVNRAFPDPQAPETLAGSRIIWEEITEPPHRGLLAFNRALIELRKEHPCLYNCRRDLAAVSFSEEQRWMVLERRASSGGSALVLFNLGSGAQVVPLPSRARDFTLALFSNEARFGAVGVAVFPPSVLKTLQAGIELPPESAAIYLSGE
jgi:maltooligosyltrehalose trehalohydrolase